MYFRFENGDLRITYELDRAAIRTGDQGVFKTVDQNKYIYSDPVSGHYVEIYEDPFRFVVKNKQGLSLLESPMDAVEPIQLVDSTEKVEHSKDSNDPNDPVNNAAGELCRVRLSFITDNKYYFGFGERFDKVNQRGNDPDIRVFEKFTHQDKITYMPIPFFLTENNFGMLVESSAYIKYYTAFADHKLLQIEAEYDQSDPCLSLMIFFGKPKDIIKKYMDRTGHPALPPKWAFGPWMSSNRWNTQAETIRQIETGIQSEIPATVVVLEAWSDENTFYIFNDAQYKACKGDEFLQYDDFTFKPEGKWPDPKKMTEYIHDNNMKLVLWQVPVIKYVENVDNNQHIIDEEYVIKEGLCASNPDSTPYRIPDNWFKNSLIPDFTNPKANDWWFQKRKYLIEDLGVDGFKTDGAEFVYRDDTCFYNGKTGALMRNEYPIEYLSAYHAFMGDDRITFSRAGFTGAQKYPLFWAGDQESTFSELRSVLNAGLSINMSGVPFWGFDIAGFYGALPGAELYIRSTELAVFSPIMQYHSSPPDDLRNNDRTPWNISEWNNDQGILEIFREYANMRMNLLPYIYQEAVSVARSCEPFMRHLMFDYPDDENVYDIDDEYLFGRSLLVAPIIDDGKRQRDVYFPDGKWVDFWDATEYGGGSIISYSCDIDRIPVFIKNNSTIPLNLNRDFKIGGSIGNDISKYQNLCFLVVGQPNGDYTFTDDLSNHVVIHYKSDGVHTEISGDLKKICILTHDPCIDGNDNYVDGNVAAAMVRLNDADYYAREFTNYGRRLVGG